MRTRIVDLALIVALVAVAGGIMWTLFNLGGSPRPPSTTPAAAPSAPDTAAPTDQALPSPPGAPEVIIVDPDEAPDGSAIVPVSPDDAAGPPGEPAPAAPSAPGTPTEPTEPAQPADPPADPGRTVPAALAEPVPSGTVSLERVGFSYVTGGAGACGVVLEPWQHVAVSRELLEAYGCGAEVTVTLDDAAGGRESFTATIADTMNPQFSRTANVYVGTDEDAFAYGLTAGSITPVD